MMKYGIGIAMLALLAGCGGGGQLALRSTGDEGGVLRGKFTQGVYGFDDHNNLHVLLVEGESQNPTQAVHLQMFWRPRAGRTPIASHATNATLHYVVFTESGAGVYSGAGFLFPKNDAGGARFVAEVNEASLRLQDSSVDFADKLGLAEASGGFSARRDDLLVQRMLRDLHLRLRDKLGYPLLIGAKD